jgi:hypothetical protein
MPHELTDHSDAEMPLRTLLTSWKLSRRSRAVGAHHYRMRMVPHASETELNREFANRCKTGGWSFIALLALAAIDYLCLRIGPSAGL